MQAGICRDSWWVANLGLPKLALENPKRVLVWCISGSRLPVLFWVELGLAMMVASISKNCLGRSCPSIRWRGLGGLPKRSMLTRSGKRSAFPTQHGFMCKWRASRGLGRCHSLELRYKLTPGHSALHAFQQFHLACVPGAPVQIKGLLVYSQVVASTVAVSHASGDVLSTSLGQGRKLLDNAQRICIS